MKQYNLISTKNIVHTGIVGLDKEIVGLYIGERTILFGKDREGVRRFMGKLSLGCVVRTDNNVTCRTSRTIYVYDCEQKKELPPSVVDAVENVFFLFEKNGRHYVRVCKNRMNGVFDFECEIN